LSWAGEGRDAAAAGGEEAAAAPEDEEADGARGYPAVGDAAVEERGSIECLLASNPPGAAVLDDASARPPEAPALAPLPAAAPAPPLRGTMRVRSSRAEVTESTVGGSSGEGEAAAFAAAEAALGGTFAAWLRTTTTV